jgi:hypothetical protein
MSNHVSFTIIIQSRLGERENVGTMGVGGCAGENQENNEVQIEDKKYDFMNALIYSSILGVFGKTLWNQH